MFFVNLDLTDLVKFANGFSEAAKTAIRKAGEQLAAQTRAHIVEEANKKLHTRRQLFVDSLSHAQVDENTWVVNLEAKARWIDDGMSAHSMVDDLLKSKKAKTAKDGSKYMVVPFQHNKGPTQQTPAQKDLLDTIKRELKQRKIPYGKLERDDAGQVKLGLIHSFDIKNAPIKTVNAPGQGKGPIGSVKQGPTGIPFLKGVRVYQKNTQNPDGSSSPKRFIMTFRVVSSKHKGQGRWDHPGMPGVKLMDAGHDWAIKQWDKEILPRLIEEISAKI